MPQKYRPPSLGNDGAGYAVRVLPDTAAVASENPDALLAALLEFADADGNKSLRPGTDGATIKRRCIKLRLAWPSFRKINDAARRVGLSLGAVADALAAEITTK